MLKHNHNWKHNLCIIVRVYLCMYFLFRNFFILLQGSYFMLFFSLISVFIYILWVQIEQSIFTCNTCHFTLSFLPVYKLFSEKGSLNPMERWSNLIGSLVSVVRSEWLKAMRNYAIGWCHNPHEGTTKDTRCRKTALYTSIFISTQTANPLLSDYYIYILHYYSPRSPLFFLTNPYTRIYTFRLSCFSQDTASPPNTAIREDPFYS